MKNYSCPSCGGTISQSNMNIKEGIALCPKCGEIIGMSDLISVPSSTEIACVLNSTPPKGITLVKDNQYSLTSDLTLKYWRFNPTVLFLIPFTAIWGGFSIWGLYVEPFIKTGTLDAKNALFGLPFLFGTIFLICLILSLLFGKRVLKLSSGKGSYAFKVFGIGRTKHFELNRSTQIQKGLSNIRVCHHRNSKRCFVFENIDSYNYSRGTRLSVIEVVNGNKKVQMFAGITADALDYIIALLYSAAR
ncbi:MAG: hypothetical protein J6V41_06185 [Kiritimatiellae bacterium]|nr:hypothetical protein [Kiritimatiellia bacterium]